MSSLGYCKYHQKTRIAEYLEFFPESTSIAPDPNTTIHSFCAFYNCMSMSNYPKQNYTSIASFPFYITIFPAKFVRPYVIYRCISI